MKSTFFTFALLFSGLTAFAAGDVVNNDINFDDKEICYTVTVNVGIGPVGGGVEVTGCGETSAEALDALIEGIDGVL